jgi:hypothetical protein
VKLKQIVLTAAIAGLVVVAYNRYATPGRAGFGS